MDALFRGLKHGEISSECSQETFLELITVFLDELNAIHPFREGNGRAQLAFIGLIGASYGHPFEFERLNRETFLAAIIASYFRNWRPLQDELRTLLA
jgi:cell filamentation protein